MTNGDKFRAMTDGELAAADAADAAYAAERLEQLKILAEFGNPFGEDNDGKVD